MQNTANPEELISDLRIHHSYISFSHPAIPVYGITYLTT